MTLPSNPLPPDRNLFTVVGRITVGVIIMLLVAAALRRMQVGGDPSSRYRDFYEFFSAAQALYTGGSAKDVFAAGSLGYIYPPLVAAALMPLVPLGLHAAAIVWTVLSAGALAAAAYLCGRTLSEAFGQPRAAWPLAAVGCLLLVDKLLAEFKMQQCNSLMLLAWVVAIWSSRTRLTLGGAALGLAANVKYVTLAALPYWLLRRNPKAALACVVAAAFFAVLPALFIGWDRNADIWRGAVLGLARASNEASDLDGESARIASMRKLGQSVTSMVIEQTAVAGHPAAALPIVAALVLAIVAACWWMYRRAGFSIWTGRGIALGPAASKWMDRRLELVEWTGLIMMILAFSPQTNPRHLVQFLPGLMLMAAVVAWGTRKPRIAAIAAIALTVGGMSLPPPYGDLKPLVPIWHRMAGPSWCMIAGWMLLLWGVLHDASRSPAAARSTT